MAESESTGYWFDLERWEFIVFASIVAFLVSTTVIAAISSGYNWIVDKNQLAATNAQIAAGTGTVLLVVVTAGYVKLTGVLIRQNEQQREQEMEINRESLRKALRKEIASIPDLAKINENEPRYIGEILDKFPRTIYEENAGDLGVLTDREVDAVVEYYVWVANTKMWALVKAENPEQDMDPGIDELMQRLEWKWIHALRQLDENLPEYSELAEEEYEQRIARSEG